MMRDKIIKPINFRFTRYLAALFLGLAIFSFAASQAGYAKSLPAAQDSPITIIEGTVALSAELTEILHAALQEAAPELGFTSDYFAATDLADRGDWVFVSIVGVSDIPDFQRWNVLDHGDWFGHVLIKYDAGNFVQAAVFGTKKYQTLLGSTPDSVVSPQAKSDLIFNENPTASAAGGNIFPYPSGYRVHYGILGVHSGWEMFGIDLGSNGDSSAGNAPNYMIASAAGTVSYKCVASGSSPSATIRIGDFLYAHLQSSSVEVNFGGSLAQGEYLGKLKTGSFSDKCGYASQQENWFHVHLGFIDSPLTMGAWTLNTSTQIWTNGSNSWSKNSWKMIGSSICTTVTDVPQAECEVLRDFYYKTAGARWTDHTGWLASTEVCTWFGVVCSGGKISEISLPLNNLNGPLTTNFSGLSSLTKLELVGNLGLTGDLSGIFGRLPAGINTLTLRGNSLTGTIPASISGFTNLTGLDLGGNLLSGDLAAITPNLPAIMFFLYLNDNDFTGTVPASMADLVNLGVLDLGGNQLNGDLTTIINNLPPSLIFLSLDANNLSGTIPASISTLPLLFSIDVSNNPSLSGTLPLSITSLTLFEFNFSGTSLCEPDDPAYESWKAGITQYSPGVCGTGTNILTNSSFETFIPVGWQDGKQISPTDGPDCNVSNARTGSCALVFEGDGTSKRIFMRYKLGGTAGDNFNLSIYRKGVSVPAADGAFIKATLFYTDGTQEVFKVDLDTGDLSKWVPAVSLPFTASKNYKRVNLDLFYKKASGRLWLDDISLTRNGGGELLANTSFETYKPDDYLLAVEIDPNEGPDCSVGNMHSGSCSVHFEGDGSNKRLLMRVKQTGTAGDLITLSIWRKGASLPALGGAYVKVEIFYTDGTSENIRLDVDSGNLAAWEEFTTDFTAAKDYKRFNVDLFYKKASGTLWLDDISLLVP